MTTDQFMLNNRQTSQAICQYETDIRELEFTVKKGRIQLMELQQENDVM